MDITYSSPSPAHPSTPETACVCFIARFEALLRVKLHSRSRLLAYWHSCYNYGKGCGNSEGRHEKAVAPSAPGQMGLIIAATGPEQPPTPVFKLVTDAFAKALFFTSVENLTYSTGKH